MAIAVGSSSVENMYIGVNSVAKKAKIIYFGVDGRARKVKRAYVGVDGKARLVYSDGS